MIVGLTGGIGSGKSTVARWLSEEGITVVNADLVARQVVEPGSEGLTRIREHFGDTILIDGALDRATLRQLIFNNAEKKSWLEGLLHPLIRAEMLRQLESASSTYAILEAPLLFENNLQRFCRRTVLVDLPESLQLERASRRDGVGAEEIDKIIRSQMPRDQRRKHADYILDNSEDLDTLKLQTLRLHNILLLLAENSEFS